MNVLLTSSGRRTYLVEYFKQALSGKGLVFASNSTMSPALMCADGYGISPLICSGEYIPWVLSFAKEHKVGLIVPLFDIDLPVLAAHRKLFEEAGIVLAVSPLDTVQTASDKYAMFRKLTEAGIGCPDCVLSLEEAKRKLSCTADGVKTAAADGRESGSGGTGTGKGMDSCFKAGPAGNGKAYFGENPSSDGTGADKGMDVCFKMDPAGSGKVYFGKEHAQMGNLLRTAGKLHRRYGANTPDGLSREEMDWPVIIKPRYGMGSLGLYTAENEAELEVLYAKCLRKVQNSYLKYESAAHPEAAVLIQEYKEGDEYGLDVICDFDGNYQATIVRYKMAMRSGETDEAVVLGPEDPEYAVLQRLGRKLAETFEIHGNMDVDVIMDPAQLFPYVIDINARFGGGYPFSHAAGVDLPRAYLAWAEGKEADPAWLQPSPDVHAYKDIAIGRYFDR